MKNTLLTNGLLDSIELGVMNGIIKTLPPYFYDLPFSEVSNADTKVPSPESNTEIDRNVIDETILKISNIVKNKKLLTLHESEELYWLYKKLEFNDYMYSDEEASKLVEVAINGIPITFENLLYSITKYNTNYGKIKELWNTPVSKNRILYNLKTGILHQDMPEEKLFFEHDGKILLFCDDNEFLEESEFVEYFRSNPTPKVYDFIVCLFVVLGGFEDYRDEINEIISDNNLTIEFDNPNMERRFKITLINEPDDPMNDYPKWVDLQNKVQLSKYSIPPFLFE